MSSKNLFFDSFISVINFIIIGKQKDSDLLIYYIKTLAIISGLQDELMQNENIRVIIRTLISSSQNFQRILQINSDAINNIQLDKIMKKILNSSSTDESIHIKEYLSVLENHINNKANYNQDEAMEIFMIISQSVKNLYLSITQIQN